jgi:homopolymeric O-antigen transport system permease protein
MLRAAIDGISKSGNNVLVRRRTRNHQAIMFHTLRSGLADIAAALRMRAVWMALASEDITDQHRRTTLGPFWLLINYLAFVGTFIVVFGRFSPIPNFPAYVAIGLFAWLYMSEVILLSVSLFVREESFIKGTTLPLSVYVMKMTAQSIIRAGYALAGCAAIVIFTGIAFSNAWPWSLAGLALILVATPAVAIVFAMAGAFFPDLQFIVSNLIRLGLFLTPIFWIRQSGQGLRAAVYDWNPFTYFLEIVRVPIYAGEVPIHAFAVAGSMTAALWFAAILLLGHNRKKVVFVL